MKYFRLLITALILGCTSSVIADDSNLQQKFVDTPVDPQVFVEQATTAGLTEVEMAKIALKTSTNDEVRHFAQMMIEGHTQMNKELRDLANSEGLNIADEPTLLKKAKTLVLSQKKGTSFDEAYAKHQVESHEQSYKLFRQAANSPSKNVREFAEAKLRTLEHHLNVAQTLADAVAQAQAPDRSTAQETEFP
jgi:putative membrane protein